MWSSRRLATGATVAGLVGGIVVTAAASGGDDGTGDEATGGDILFALLLLGAPFLAGLLTRSVTSSRLLRPVGSLAAVLSGLCTAVHVGVVVDGRGGGGVVYAVPSILATVLVAAAVQRGPVAVVPRPASPPSADGPRTIAGPPLDVLSPLLDARVHAVKSLAAWVIVVIVGGTLTYPVVRASSWPRVAAPVEAEVVSVTTNEDDIDTVVFEGSTPDGRFVRWTHESEDSTWEVGDARTAHLDHRGRLHSDQQLGFAGTPLLFPVLFMSAFAAFAARRVWGLWVALWDARNGSDAPRLGYGAVIDDPAPKTVRPLLAVWEHDPTCGDRLARPDAVYRADDETGDDLQCPASSVVVRRAWIDTGFWQHAKPRWVGFEDGVAVPHRRMLFGRWYVRVVTRRSEVEEVVPLEHGPPEPGREAADRPSWSRHKLPSMVAWRMVLALFVIPLTFLYDDDGSPAEISAERPLR